MTGQEAMSFSPKKWEVKVSLSNGTQWKAEHDGLGRRLVVSTYDVSAHVVASSATKESKSLYDPEVEFLEIGTWEDGVKWAKVHGPDGDSSYGAQQGIGGLEAIMKYTSSGLSPPDAISYPLLDAYGHVAAWVDTTNEVADFSAATRNLAYGPAPGEEAPNYDESASDYEVAHSWQGRRTDFTGFIWMGARVYAPDSGRFLSADPLGHLSLIHI